MMDYMFNNFSSIHVYYYGLFDMRQYTQTKKAPRQLPN